MVGVASCGAARTARGKRLGMRSRRWQPKLAVLSKGDHVMSQNHFTLSFPLQSPADAKGADGAASTHDAGAVPSGEYSRHDSLLALHGAEREDVAVSR
jgi:hypothetical protein